MPGQPPSLPPLGRILEKVRNLAQQVRSTAERVHREAEESRRLIGIAKRHSQRGRELSKAGRKRAGAVKGSIADSLDTVNQAERRLAGKRP